MNFTSHEAIAYAAENRLSEWCDLFLMTAPFGKNVDLAEQLRVRPTFYRGPLESQVASLVRVCGPEPEMTFRETEEKWNGTVQMIESLIVAQVDLPPLFVKIRNGKHFVADGSHRLEAMRRQGRARYWTIWYTHEEREFEGVGL